MPNANDAVASSKGNRYLPTHHVVAGRRAQQRAARATPHQDTAWTTATQP